MAVNFGILSQIAEPKVVANLPQQPNQMDSLATGVMSGLAQGQQLQLGAQQKELNNLKLQEARQGMADQQQLRQAGSKGEDVWLNTLVSQGKLDEAKAYQIKQLQYQRELLNNKSSLLDLNEKEAGAADKANIINVKIVDAVSQMPEDQQYSAAQKYILDAKKQYPDLKDKIINNFDSDTFASVMRTNELIQSTKQARDTNDVATLKQLQTMRDQLNAAKQQMVAQNRPTQGIDQQIKEVNNQIAANAKQNENPSDIQKKVDYITQLKQNVDGAATDEEKKKAQDQLDLAMSQLKQDQSLWGQIKGKVADIIGTAANALTPSVPKGRVVVQDAKGNHFTVPSDQAEEAQKQGYTLVK